MADELRDVLAPLAQRRQSHGHDIQAIEEIFTEASCSNLFLQVSRCRREDPNVNLYRALAADAMIALVGKDPENLHLVVRGMSAISSRNNVPPWACSSKPGRAIPSDSLPNNSSSTLSGLIIAAESTMNGAFALGLH